MKKILTGSIASIFLMAGVAAAAGPNSAVVRVGDRLGSSSSTTNKDQGAPLLLIGGIALGAVVIIAIASSNHGHSHSVSA